MEGNVKVTYLSHSGFLLETEESYLLFDYWKGHIPALSSQKTLYVFSSHAHHDHFNKDIFKLENSCKEVHYILSFDIKEADKTWKKAEHVTFMDPYQKITVGNCTVETLTSTDEGVAFLVNVEGHSIYHAGDLHRWEWPGDFPDINEAAIRNYEAEMDKIAGRKFDLAFVVLDPRQEEAGGRGMDTFLTKVGARYVFPMHVWDDYGLIASYKKENQLRFITSQIMEITKEGQEFIVR